MYCLRTAGHSAVFAPSILSLDLIVAFARDELGKLSQVVLVIMVIEVIVVFSLCILCVFLILKRLESARMGGVLMLVGLPAPVLRTMTSRPLTVRAASAFDQS